MHLGVCFRTQVNYLTTVGLLEAHFEALSEEIFRLMLFSEWCSPVRTGPGSLFMVRHFPIRMVWTSATPGPGSLLSAACGCSLPRGWGGVCMCVRARACTHLLITGLEDSGHDWALGGGEPPAVSRARFWARTFSPPRSSLGMRGAPASSLPSPPPRPRKTHGFCLLVTHGWSSVDGERRPSQRLPCLPLRRGSLSYPYRHLKHLSGGG